MELQGFIIAAVLALSGEPPGTAADSPDPESWPRLSLGEAHRIAPTVADPFRRAQVLEQTAAVAIGLGDVSTACGLLVDAFEVARAIDDRSLRDLALRNIGVTQARCSDVRGAAQTVEAIGGREPRDIAASAIVDAQVSAGQLGAALQVARAIDAPLTMSQALRKIAVVHAREERFADARAVADDIPDDMLRALALADIARCMLTSEMRKHRSGALHRTTRAPTPARPLGYVAAIQASFGRHAGRAHRPAGIKGPATRAYALARIADVLLQVDDVSQAEDLLSRALVLARSAKPGETTATVLCEIAQTLCYSCTTRKMRSLHSMRRSRSAPRQAVPGRRFSR
jgi:hypothetical protein